MPATWLVCCSISSPPAVLMVLLLLAFLLAPAAAWGSALCFCSSREGKCQANREESNHKQNREVKQLTDEVSREGGMVCEDLPGVFAGWLLYYPSSRHAAGCSS